MASSSSPLPRTSLMRRVLIVSAVLLLAFIVAGVAITYGNFHLRQLAAQYTTMLEVKESVSKTLMDLARLDNGLSTAYPTHNIRFLQEETSLWITDLKHDRDTLQQLNAQLPPDTLTRKSLTAALPRLNQVIILAEGILSQAQINNWSAADFRRQMLRRQEIALRSTLERVYVHADEYNQQHAQALANTTRLLMGVPLFITLLGLLFLLGGILLLRRHIIQPLETLTTQIQHFAEGDFSVRVPVHQGDEIGQLAHTFNLMADRIQEAYATLADKVEERTRALQQRTAQLQAATEIGRAVAAINDLDTMLQEAVRLISQRYGFYHVAAFLAEENAQRVVIRAAYTQNGNAAERLLAEHLSIPQHDSSVIGQTLTTIQPHTAQFSPDAPPRPELAATRIEMALPLKSGNRILGVLDVHSQNAEPLTPEEITALQMVADLLAVAIANAYLLRETQSALEAAQRAYEQLSQQGWQRFLQMQRVLGFRLEPSGQIRPLPKEQVKHSLPAASDETPPSSPSDDGEALHEHRFLVAARGRTVAVAQLRKPTPWKPAEKRLLDRLADRLGSVLESARLYAEAQRRSAQLQIASEIARDASGTLDLDELLRKAINLVRERFGFYHASVFLLDESGQYAYVKESTGEAGEQLKARRHRLAVGSASVIGQTLASGAPVVVNDVSQSEIHHFNPLLPDTQAEMGLPLKVGNELIGALDIQAVYTHAFSEEDVAVLQILADQLAIAVVNARLFAEAQEHLVQHRYLHQITAAAASATTVEEAIRNVVESLHAVRPDEAVALLVPTEDTPQTLRLAAWAGHTLNPEAARRIRIPLGEGAIGRAAADKQPVLIGDTSASNNTGALSPDTRAILVEPLIYRGELLGVLDLESAVANAYDEHDLEMLRTLANSLAAIIANIRLLEEVRRHSNELSLLYEITAAAASEVDLDKLLNLLAHRLQEGLDVLHCGVILFDDNGQTGTLVASASAEGAPGAGMVGTKIPLDSSSIQIALRTGKPVVYRDITQDERIADIRPLLEQRGTRQLIVVPLLSRDEIIGTLGLDIADPNRQITDNDLRLLEQIARQIATSVEVARLFQQAVRTAEREHTVTEITTKIRATNDPQAILQTAIEELRKALRVQQTQIVFIDEDGNSPSDNA